MRSLIEQNPTSGAVNPSLVFSAAMCDQALALAARIGWERGRVERMEEAETKSPRRCDSCFLLPNHASEALYGAIATIFLQHDAVSSVRLREMPQIARYRAGDHFDWHQDANEWVTHRVHTLSIQLTDPSEYEGGELELDDGSLAPKARGSVFLFPAHTWHRVRPIREGRRIALVAWSTHQTHRSEHTTHRRNLNETADLHRIY